MAFQDDFAQALSQAGYSIDPSAVPDEATLEQGLNAALQWYQSLDSTTKSAIDDKSTPPGPAAIYMVNAGIVSGIDSLLQAFDQAQGSLGTLLQAAQQALQTAKQANQ